MLALQSLQRLPVHRRCDAVYTDDCAGYEQVCCICGKRRAVAGPDLPGMPQRQNHTAKSTVGLLM